MLLFLPALSLSREFPSNGNEAKFVSVGQVDAAQGAADAILRCVDFGYLVIIGKFQETADVGVNQAFRYNASDLALWGEDFADAEAGEDAFLVVAARPNDDTGGRRGPAGSLTSAWWLRSFRQWLQRRHPCLGRSGPVTLGHPWRPWSRRGPPRL